MGRIRNWDGQEGGISGRYCEDSAVRDLNEPVGSYGYLQVLTFYVM
jgi:hypothetical protein